MIRPITVLIAAVLLLGPLLVVELGTRLLIGAGRLPAAPSAAVEADISIANLLRLGQADALILGTSSSRAGIDPAVLERLILEETGQDAHIQNAALAGMSLAGQRLLVSELARLDQLPELVIVAATPLSLAGAQGGESDWFLDSELGRLWNGCGDEVAGVGWLECQLGQVSALWRWRGQPHRFGEAVVSGQPTTIVAPNGRTLHESGWLSTRFMPPNRLPRLIERSLGRFDEHLEVPHRVVDGFSALIDELRANDAQVLVLRIPYMAELDEELAARNPEWEQELEAGYALLAETADVDIIDPGGFGDWAELRSFRDPRHLSREGAGPFTRQLWDAPQIREPLLEALSSGA